MRQIFLVLLLIVFFGSAISPASARQVRYSVGDEVAIYVKQGQPSQIRFSCEIDGLYSRRFSTIDLEYNGPYLVLMPTEEVPDKGEVVLVVLENNLSYSVRVLLANEDNPRDVSLYVSDPRNKIERSKQKHRVPFRGHEFSKRKPWIYKLP